MLEALRLVHALYDPLRPQMHNQFKIVARLLERRWKNGSVDAERTMNGFTKFKPSKEGQGWKEKKELGLRRVLAFTSVLQRRLHVLEADKYLEPVYAADGMTIDRDKFLEQFFEMVHDSNVDEELADMNHEIFDVLLPFLLEKRMTRNQITEVAPIAAAYWLPWLQETNCPRIFRHMVEQTHANTGRSAERNMFVLNSTAPSQTGTPGTGVEVDQLQELIVMITQQHRLKKASCHADAEALLTRINTSAANLDIMLETIPFLEREWAALTRSKARSRSMKRKEAVRQLSIVYLRHFAVADPLRRIASGEAGAVERWELSVRLTLRPASAAVLQARVWYALEVAGGPLTLLCPAVLLELAAEDSDGGTPPADRLPQMIIEPAGKMIVFGARLEGACFTPRGPGMKGGDQYRVSTQGVAAGEVAARHRQARVLAFQPMPGLTIAALAGVKFELLLSNEMGASPERYIRLGWQSTTVMASRSSQAAQAVRSLLPNKLLILSIAGTQMVKIVMAKREQVLFQALKEGAEIVVADAVSLEEALKQAYEAAHPVLLSGMPASKSPAGKPRYSTKAFTQTTPEQRRCVHGQPQPPPATTGEPQSLRLYLYKQSMTADAPQGGARRVVADKTSGLEQANALASSRQAAAAAVVGGAVTAEMVATQRAEEARHTHLLQHTRTTHLLSAAKARGVGLGKLHGRPNTADRGDRPASQRTYRHPNSRLSSRAADLSSGDNTKLKFYKNLTSDLRTEHPHRTAALNMMYEAHVKGEAFDYSRLVRSRESTSSVAAAAGGVRTRTSQPPQPSIAEDARRQRLESDLQAKLREIEVHDSTVIGGQDGETAGSVANSMPTLLGHQQRRRELEREVHSLTKQLDKLVNGGDMDLDAGPSQPPTQLAPDPMQLGADESEDEDEAQLLSSDEDSDSGEDAAVEESEAQAETSEDDEDELAMQADGL